MPKEWTEIARSETDDVYDTVDSWLHDHGLSWKDVATEDMQILKLFPGTADGGCVTQVLIRTSAVPRR